MCVKKATNAMSERLQGGSISRTLLLPREHHLGTGTLGTFRLRHILAEDGCIESQVALAKSLLTTPSKTAEERAFNAKLAVYWLLQAAQRGQDEAFHLLKDCSNCGIGINAINSYEVEKCLKYSEEEKISRRVAFSVFRAIMSDTEDIIPADIFKDKIDLIFKEETREEFPKKPKEDPLVPLLEHDPLQSLSHKKSDESSFRSQPRVSFSEVVNSVQSCLEGNVPLVSLKQVTDYNEYKKWLSIKYIHMLWDLILQSAEKLFQNLSFLILPVAVFLMFIFLCVTSYLTPAENELSHFIIKSKLFVAILFCLLTMVSTTCFVININFGGSNVKKWLHLIKFFEPNVRSEEVEKKYLSKTVIPITAFFFISLMYIAMIPLNSNPVVLADIGVLSFVLMLFVDRTISHQRYYVNVSFVLNALACLYKANMLQSIFANSLSFLNYNLAYEVVENFYVHVSLISCLTLPFILPYLYVKMTLGKQKCWHLVLLPHLMSLTWMNLASTHLANSSTAYLCFSLFSWLTILVLSKYIGTVLTFILYLLFKIAITLDYLCIEVFIFSFIFIILYALSSYLVTKFKISYESKLWSSVLCFMVLMLSYQVIKPQPISVDDASYDVLPWEKYQTFCHHNAWYRTNTAEVQISCLSLKGREIQMEGTVTAIDIIQVHNNVELFASILPEPLRGWFVCAFGKCYTNCNDETLSQIEKERCKVYQTLNLNPCHLHNWDKYKYQIILEVSTRTSPEVVLISDHASSTFVRNLKEGDSLQVIGKLESNIGSTSPKFNLQQATCTSCYPDITFNPSSVPSLPDHSFSFKNVVWFYFAPFLQYEPK